MTSFDPFPSQDFKGLTCMEPVTMCDINPCQNAGTCHVTDDNEAGFMCSCPPDMTGFNCETYDPCDSAPCHHDGTCIKLFETFACQCPPTWNGLRCQTYDRDFFGGIGSDPIIQIPLTVRPVTTSRVVVVETTTVKPTTTESPYIGIYCPRECTDKSGDGICNVSININ